MKPKIFVTRKISDIAEEKLKKDFEITLNLKDEPVPTSELIKLANEYDGFISTGFDSIGEDFFKNLNGRLKIIAQVGVGYDNISIKSAKDKKIKITNTPNVLNEAVAEITILLILASSRRIGEAFSIVKSGNWKYQKPDLTKFMVGNSVIGKTLGIIGVGAIGQIVAENAGSLGMNLIGNDIEISENNEIWKKLNIKYCSFEEVVSQSDAITIHVPLTKKTSNLFNEKEFKNMQKGSFIINSSRGGIVNEEDIVKFLKNGHLGGAMLDVFESEPIDNVSIFSGIENLILTPHIAGLTCESNIRVSEVISNKILKYLASGEE